MGTCDAGVGCAGALVAVISSRAFAVMLRVRLRLGRVGGVGCVGRDGGVGDGASTVAVVTTVVNDNSPQAASFHVGISGIRGTCSACGVHDGAVVVCGVVVTCDEARVEIGHVVVSGDGGAAAVNSITDCDGVETRLSSLLNTIASASSHVGIAHVDVLD